jgi:hypothetical protein
VEEHRSEADIVPEPGDEVAAKAADLGNVDKLVQGGNVVLEVVGDIVEEEEVVGHVYVVIVN